MKKLFCSVLILGSFGALANWVKDTSSEVIYDQPQNIKTALLSSEYGNLFNSVKAHAMVDLITNGKVNVLKQLTVTANAYHWEGASSCQQNDSRLKKILYGYKACFDGYNSCEVMNSGLLNSDPCSTLNIKSK